jgi:hypothetical protein
VGRIRFEERMAVPARVYVVAFAVGAVFIGAITLIGGSSPLVLAALAGGAGAFAALLLWWSTGRRRIRIDDEFLTLGYGDRVDLRWVREIEVVGRDGIRAIRQRLLEPGAGAAAAAPAMLGGRLGLGLGQIALGLSTVSSAERRRGVVCPAWAEQAVHILNLPAQQADEWLVATTRPAELEAALRDAVAEAQAKVVA